jgi:tRNA threonylcarbamoyladenosine biosynthesis protein TsaE
MSSSSAMMGGSQVDLADLDATAVLAAAVSSQLRLGDMVGLTGPLGAGKTAFARHLIAARCKAARQAPPKEVPSPTFTLVQTYDIGDEILSHFDLYRLDRPEDSQELGFDDALSDGPVLVEWPDRLGPFIPADRLDMTFVFDGREDDARSVGLSAHGSWMARLDTVLAQLSAAMIGP